MKLFSQLTLSILLATGTSVFAAPADCGCKNCSCTEESNCGCLSGKECSCTPEKSCCQGCAAGKDCNCEIKS